jgi:hypothetical protein
MIMVGKIYAGKDNSAKLITHPARGNGNLVINSLFQDISALHLPKYIIGESWTVAADSDDWEVTYENPGITLTNNQSSGNIYLVQKFGWVPTRGVKITATCRIFLSSSSGSMYMERYDGNGTQTIIASTSLDTSGTYHITGLLPPPAVVDHANIVIAVNPGKSLRIAWCRVDEDTSLPSYEEFVNIAMTRLQAKYYVQRARMWTTYQGTLGWGMALFHISEICPRIVPSIWYYRDPSETSVRPQIYLPNGTVVSVQESQLQARIFGDKLELVVTDVIPNDIGCQAMITMNHDEIIFNAL